VAKGAKPTDDFSHALAAMSGSPETQFEIWRGLSVRYGRAATSISLLLNQCDSALQTQSAPANAGTKHLGAGIGDP